MMGSIGRGIKESKGKCGKGNVGKGMMGALRHGWRAKRAEAEPLVSVQPNKIVVKVVQSKWLDTFS
jgi:hypothetical protein